MATQTEDILGRIQSLKGVMGVIILNNAGIPIKSTFDNSTSIQYASLVEQFIKMTKSVNKIDPSDDLIFLRIHTKIYNICIISETQYVMIVVQNPTGVKTQI